MYYNVFIILERDDIMKKAFTKVSMFLLKAVPVVATLALIINTNSVATPVNGQPKAPANLKKYRLF